MGRLLAVFGTLRGRLVLLVCFATLPALLFTFYAADAERTAVLRRIEKEALLLAQLASREHAHQLEGAKSLLVKLGRGLQAAPGGPEGGRCPAFLPALLAGYPQFTTIGLLSVDGRLLCSAHPAPGPVSFAGNVALERALRSRGVEAGEYTLGPIVGRPVLHLAYAVRAPGGEPLQVVFVGLDLQWLDQLAQQAGLPPGYALLIVDRAGRILGRSADATWPASAEGAAPALLRAVRAPGPVSADVAGIGRRFLVAAPMRGVPEVSVVASLPFAQVHGEANRAFYRTVAGLGLLTALTIACVLFAAELTVLRVVRQLSRAARQFGAGDLSARAEASPGVGELAELTRAFNGMAEALEARQREAAEAQARLRALSQRLAVAREAEAEHIARELHDELGQVLTSVKVDLATLHRACLPAGDGPGAALQAGLAELNQRLDDAVGFVRRVSSDLRPPVLDRLGLGAALEALARELEGRTRLAVVLDVEVAEPVGWLSAITLYRIVGEALTNVVRHAGATEVSVDLREGEGSYRLTVRDDGRGIARGEAEDPRSLGILGMKERCLLVGGTFSISGEPGAGTTIVVTIPRGGSSEPDAARPAR